MRCLALPLLCACLAGIGFKSVFRISNSPEVHSNNFHFKFDVRKGELGYIVPTICAPPSGEHLGKGAKNETHIVLPFQTERQSDEPHAVQLVTQEFREQLMRDLDPSLLLFLRRLQRIEAVDFGLGIHRCVLL